MAARRRGETEEEAPETTGVEVELLATVDLGPEIEGMAGRQLRMRMVTIEPGGVFGPIHDHKDRPGTVYILQGTITDHRDGVSTDYGPGVGWPEDRNTTHWLENRGTIPAVEISVDIVTQEEARVPGAPIEALRRVPLFEELDTAELQAVADSMHEANVPAGAVVTAEGGPGDGFFVIESGEAQVTIDGRPRGAMTAGDYFGEIALLQGSDRTATVTATSDLRCYALTPWDFRSLVEGNPSIAWKTLRSMAARLS